MKTHILVPLDGSSAAEQALEYVMKVIGSGGKVTLLSVVELPDIWTSEDANPILGRAIVPEVWRSKAEVRSIERAADIRKGLRFQAEAYLEQLALHFSANDIQVEISILTDIRPADAIIETAQEKHVDAIFMLTRGRTDLGRRLFGTVATAVVSAAPCPVFVIPYKEEADKEIAHSERKDTMLQHVVVPLDGSLLAEAALDQARQVTAPGGIFTLVSVVNLPTVPLYGHEMAVSLVSGYQRDLEEALAAARTYVNQIAEELRAEGYQVREIAQFGESAAEMIVNTAQHYMADAIVMSTHGRSGFSRWLFGSVTSKVLNSMTCPVLVVPSRVVGHHEAPEVAEANHS